MDFAGISTHPAYGIVNLTVITIPTASCDFDYREDYKEVLMPLFYPHAWPQKIRLSPVTDTVFAVKLLTRHGLGDPTTGKDIVW